MHVIYFFLILFKTAVYYFNILLIQHLSINNFYFLISICLYIWYLRRKKFLKKNYYNNLLNEKDYTKESDKLALANHILQYQYKNKKDRYLSFIFILFTFLCYISIIFFFRFKNLSNIIDLKKMYVFLIALYAKMNFLILIYNFIILILCIYAFLLTVNEIKTFYLKHVMKAHFYLAKDNSQYKKIFEKRSYNNKLYLIQSELHSYHMRFFSLLFHKIAQEEHIPDFEPKPKVDALYVKYQKFLVFSQELVCSIPYNFHYFCFFFILLYDLFCNNLILLHVAYFLPFMFLFHLYTLYSKFVREKVIFGLIESVNMFFYHEVIIINDKWMLVDGLPSETDHLFPFEFLKFEINGFKQ